MFLDDTSSRRQQHRRKKKDCDGGLRSRTLIAVWWLIVIVVSLMGPTTHSIGVGAEEDVGSSSSSSDAISTMTTVPGDDDEEEEEQQQQQQSAGDEDGEESGKDESASAGESTKNTDDDEETKEEKEESDIDEEETETHTFTTVGEETCQNATSIFVQGLPGLLSAIQTYEATQLVTLDNETESGWATIKYPDEAVRAIQAACELHKGYWSFLDTVNFTCVTRVMDTMAVQVDNAGHCLANMEECYNTTTIDSALLIENLGVERNLTCWEDTDDDDKEDEEDENEDTTISVNDSDDINDTNNDKDGANEDQQSTNVDTTTANNTDIDTLDKNVTAADEDNAGDSLDLSKLAEKCMEETKAMDANSEIQKAVQKFGNTMHVDLEDVKNMTLEFADEDVQRLQSVCSSAGGYFTLIEDDDFDCDMMSLHADLNVKNIANCIADTDNCKTMNPLVLMESVFTAMGIKCVEKQKHQQKENGNEINDDHDDNQNQNGDHNNNNGTSKSDEFDNDDDDTVHDSNESDNSDYDKALGLTESEMMCMHNSTLFIDSSAILSNATLKYQRAVIMTDPTKLGYPQKNFFEMEHVCKDENGIWSSIMSKDVTCIIHGRERCLNVYNFGSCITKNDDCRKIDPMVFVKGFFFEVLKFSCRADCTQHNTPSNSAHHASPTMTHKSNDPRSSTTSTNNNGGPSSYLVAITVLCGAIIIGYFAYYIIRNSTGQERMPRRAYEMTGIGDLHFQTLT